MSVVGWKVVEVDLPWHARRGRQGRPSPLIAGCTPRRHRTMGHPCGSRVPAGDVMAVPWLSTQGGDDDPERTCAARLGQVRIRP